MGTSVGLAGVQGEQQPQYSVLLRLVQPLRHQVATRLVSSGRLSLDVARLVSSGARGDRWLEEGCLQGQEGGGGQERR